MSARDLRQALDDSLELVLRRGMSPEQAAKRFPEWESDLLPLLGTMANARQAPAMRMPDSSKNRVWESVEDKITATAPRVGRLRVQAGRFLRQFNYPQLAASLAMISFLVASSWALASALTPAPVSSPIHPDTGGSSVVTGVPGGTTAPGRLSTDSYASGAGSGININPNSGASGTSGSASTGSSATVASAGSGNEDSSGDSAGDSDGDSDSSGNASGGSSSSGSSGSGGSSSKKPKPKPPQGNHGTGDEGNGPGLPVSTPTSLVVYAGDLENDLSWTAPTDANGRLKGYDVYRSDTEDGIYEKVNDEPVGSTGYQDPIPVDELGLYYYKVRSVSKWGHESGFTEAAPNLYVKMTHRFSAAGSDEVIAANGKLSFLVPTASLTQDTTVTIDERDTAPTVEDARQASPPFDFGPDGLSFSDSAPAHLSMGYYFGVSDAELDLLLSTALKLYYLDDAGNVVQVADSDVAVDAASKTVNAAVRHFTTYWSGAVVNPHGNSSSGATDWCTTICHGLHGGGYSATKWNAYEVCIQCHGNTNSYDAPAGAGLTQPAPNIQAEFIDCADQQSGGGSTPYTWTQTTVADFVSDNLTDTVTTDTAGGEVVLDATPAVPGGSSLGRSDDFEDGSLDPTWTVASVGVNPAANASESGGLLTFSAGSGTVGFVPGNTSDDYGFIYKYYFTENATYTLRLSSLVSTGGNPRDWSSYLMLRQGPSTANSVFFAVGWDRVNQDVRVVYRNSAGAASSSIVSGVNSTNCWLRIVRAGTNCTGYLSTDGIGYTSIGSFNMTALTTPYYGISISRGTNPGQTATGTHDFITVEPDGGGGPGTPLMYHSPGFITTTDIAPSDLTSWGRLTWTENVPASTDFDIGVLGWNGSSWTAMGTATASPYDLSGINPATYSKLKLRGRMTTSDTTYTPWLYDWTVTATRTPTGASLYPDAERHPVPEGLMVCSACHSPHRKTSDLTDNLYFRFRDPISPGNPGSAYTYSYTASPLGNNFCWGCHGTQANVWSVAVGQIASTSYYTQSMGDHRTGYEALAAHDVSLPASGASPNAWVPPTSALGDRQGANQSTNVRCENCHYHHGTSQSRTQTGYRLTAAYSTGVEENLCYQCHTQTWKAGMKNIRGEFSKAYSHKVGSQTFSHDAYSESLTGVIAGQRHVECFDCHDTHRARIGTHSRGTNAVTGALVGAMGVLPNYGSTTGTAGSYALTQSATREYQICLRCHSSFDASAPVEIGADFNTNNPSYHPVTSVGRNSTMAAGTLVAPWAVSSTMYCSDCHTSDSTSLSGPHGSTNAYMLARAYSTASRTSSAGFLCYICHQYNTYYAGTNTQSYFKKPGNDNLHYTHVNAAKAPQMNCWRCHDSHGSGVGQRLIAEGRGINAFIGPAPSNYSTSNCTTTGCHGSDDNCYTCHGETGGNQRVVYLMGRGFAGSVNGGVAKTYHHNMTSPTTAFAGTSADPPTTSVSTNSCEGRCHAKHAEHTGTDAKSLRAGNVERALCLYCHNQAGSAYPPKTFTSTSFSGTAHDYTTLGYTENRWNPSVGYSTNYQYTKDCAKCHAPHGSNVRYNLNEVVENMGNTGYANYTTRSVTQNTVERACYACHQAQGPGPNVEAEIPSVSYHPVNSAAQQDRHRAGTESLTNATRHVECQDCHNPHQAGTTAHVPGSQGLIGTVNRGVWGVTASLAGSLGNPTTTYSAIPGTSVLKLWQICGKCHSRYGWTTAIPTPSRGPNNQVWNESDVLNDFNPQQYAYHPLFTAGRNQPPVTTTRRADGTNVWDTNARRRFTTGGGISNTFVDGWTSRSLVTCTDCHDKPATSPLPDGPHGSSFKWLLKGQDPNVKVTLYDSTVIYPNSSTGALGGNPIAPANFCSNCHRADIYGNSATSGPNATADDLSRIIHQSGFVGQCQGTNADGAGTYFPTGCMNCHGGNSPGEVHGSSRPAGASGDIMGKRFTNGSSWERHQLGDNWGQQIGCWTKSSADNVNTCTKHTGSFKTADPVYFYPWN